jgi:arylsulfatase A-like enzyme
MTSLYPSTHGVHRNVDRLPAAANTIAESYRTNGYATVSFSSVMWTGAGTNMHQGFEELHERSSVPGRARKRRPVIMEKQPQGQPGFPSGAQSFAIIDGGWKLIHNTIRPPDRPEYELYEYPKDRFDSNNVADRHPAVVERLAKTLGGWRSMAAAARLKPDTETTKSLSAEELRRLRSLGYVN